MAKIKTFTQKQSSLFVGRWQPFHKGHQKLIESVLKKDKPVVVAIRDTEISHDNPYSTFERWTMIQKALQKYGELVKIIVIPDIDEICYGRDVGYAIRKIEIDEKFQQISGTKTRLINPPTKPIFWLTGQSGAGKTTIANLLQSHIGGVILDGDEMRKTISKELGFSKNDREIHNLRVARLAKTLAKTSPVIVSVIAPFTKTRQKIDKIAKPVWIYVKKELPNRKNYPYEVPKNVIITVDSDSQTPDRQVEIILKYFHKNFGNF